MTESRCLETDRKWDDKRVHKSLPQEVTLSPCSVISLLESAMRQGTKYCLVDSFPLAKLPPLWEPGEMQPFNLGVWPLGILLWTSARDRSFFCGSLGRISFQHVFTSHKRSPEDYSWRLRPSPLPLSLPHGQVFPSTQWPCSGVQS